MAHGVPPGSGKAPGQRCPQGYYWVLEISGFRRGKSQSDTAISFAAACADG